MAVLLPIGMSEGFSATQRNSGGSDEILVFPIKQPRFLVIQSFSFKPSAMGVVGLIFDDWLVGGEIPHGEQLVEGVNQVRPFFYDRM